MAAAVQQMPTIRGAGIPYQRPGAPYVGVPSGPDRPPLPPNQTMSPAVRMALMQQAFRNRMPGPIFTSVGLTPEELLAAKKPFTRKSVDYNASMINMIENRIWQRDFRDRPLIQPDPGYIPLMTPSMDYPDNPSNAVTTKFVRTAMNKMKCPVFSITWTANGRRLLTGSSSGEFTLWNGLQFNFETILQAHDAPIRAMTWSNAANWLLSGDHNGFIKYWQTNMNNVKMFQAHREIIRDICFSPTDNKFASCSDDATVRIWDFYSGNEEKVLRGHGADVKTVHWHPTYGLVVSGSKDAQQPIKLWDPKSGRSLLTLYPHKAAVTVCKFSPNGHWLLTGSRDHILKLFDVRNMKQELNTLRGHKREVICLDWHPLYDTMVVSGGGDGSILYWDVSLDKQIGGVDNAHDGIVWNVKWHPLGHIVASASNDFATKFWTRNNPGDRMQDKYNLNFDEELETEELVANQDPVVRPSSPEADDEKVYGIPEHDSSIPALNPDEVEKIPKTKRRRYQPPQFSMDMLAMHNDHDRAKRGDKRIDPRFKMMWSSYQRPDLMHQDQKDYGDSDRRMDGSHGNRDVDMRFGNQPDYYTNAYQNGAVGNNFGQSQQTPQYPAPYPNAPFPDPNYHNQGYGYAGNQQFNGPPHNAGFPQANQPPGQYPGSQGGYPPPGANSFPAYGQGGYGGGVYDYPPQQHQPPVQDSFNDASSQQRGFNDFDFRQQQNSAFNSNQNPLMQNYSDYGAAPPDNFGDSRMPPRGPRPQMRGGPTRGRVRGRGNGPRF